MRGKLGPQSPSVDPAGQKLVSGILVFSRFLVLSVTLDPMDILKRQLPIGGLG